MKNQIGSKARLNLSEGTKEVRQYCWPTGKDMGHLTIELTGFYGA